MSNGFIYIMSNPSFSHGQIKIGKSSKDPSIRKEELNTTSLPEPFVLEYFALVGDYDAVELNVHRKLSAYRRNRRREFFDCTVPKAILAIRESATVKHEEVFYKSPEEIQEQLNKEIQARQQAEALRRANVERLRVEEEAEGKRAKQQAFNDAYYEAWSLPKDKSGNPAKPCEWWEDALGCLILGAGYTCIIWLILVVSYYFSGQGVAPDPFSKHNLNTWLLLSGIFFFVDRMQFFDEVAALWAFTFFPAFGVLIGHFLMYG